MSPTTADNGIYYFLGNISSHILHALPLHKKLGGTFVVLSEKAKKEVEAYGVPVIALDDKPRRWTRFGYRVKPVFHYLKLDTGIEKTVNFLNEHAKVVLFYELYDFPPAMRLSKPKTVFLTHGNMLKNYMGESNRLQILEQYDCMAALGPYLKKEFVEKNGINPSKLVDLGIARTDEIVASRGKVIFPKKLAQKIGVDPKKPVVSYMPTFWGASSIYTVGKEIVRNFPDEYTLLFRPHPQTPKKLLQEYFDIIATKAGNVVYVPEGRYEDLGLLEILAASSAIIGDVSSVMLEAILTEKPLLFAYDTGSNQQPASDYAAIRDVVEYSARIDAQTVIDLPKFLQKSLRKGIDKKIWQAAKTRNFFHATGDSIAAITKLVNDL